EHIESRVWGELAFGKNQIGWNDGERTKRKKSGFNRNSEESSVATRLGRFSQTFALSKLLLYAVTAALSTEFNRSYERVYASLQDDVALTQPTKGLVLAIYRLFESRNEQEIGCFLEDQANYKAIFRTRKAGTRYADSLSVEPYLISYLLDNVDLPSFHPELGRLFYHNEELPQLQIRSRQVDTLVEWYTGYLRRKREQCCGRVQRFMVSLEGHAGNGRHFLAKHFARNIGKNLFFFNTAAALSYATEEWSGEKLRAYLALTDALLCVEANVPEQEAEEAQAKRIFWESVQEAGDFLLLITDEKGAGLGGFAEGRLRMAIDYPDLAQKQVLWEMQELYVPMEEGNYAEEFAGKYSLTVKEIGDVARVAHYRAMMEGREQLCAKDIAWAVQNSGKEGLKGLADLIKTSFAWEDLIIERSEKESLKLLCDRVRYRKKVGLDWGFYQKMPYGRGVSAVFYGNPGTGKTMAASVVANTLGLDLYQINLSALLSKYIGETEKNIEDLFQRAKQLNGVLFFDEADSLFAKRTQVKDANDRNANSISGQLLKRFEEYEGIVILATNFIHNIDDAFKRRIQFLIPFTFPDARTRLLLFQSLLPDKVPCEEEIDCSYFSSAYELSGSNIKEVLLTAAFLAAGNRRGLCNRDVAEAIKYCYRKQGKSLTSGECKYLEYTK
ncbi:MAG: ATP-binding protein, partial [Lachnospiraceae bacterium]|nr:ATP-binding protein [Lachnospiraceae bacterium]